ncbi:MAG: AAA family ATPase [Armatimonadetes bacterium]|nr:AAA family ATPase [Armatimonadota bacterium]
MIIAIGGLIAVGKSTAAARLAQRLGFRCISAGAVFRDLAQQRGMTLEEFGRLAERDHSVDRDLDRLQAEMAATGNAVVESRLCGWVVNAHLKVWLRAPVEVRAGRLALREGTTLEVAMQKLIERETSERTRYRTIYGIDLDDLAPYHVILDTDLWLPGPITDTLAHLARTMRDRGPRAEAIPGQPVQQPLPDLHG